MISYKVKGIILAVIISLASIMMPFSVYADTITASNINGISITLDEVTFIEYKQFTIDGVNTNVARNYYNYIAEIQFDKSYLGNINISMQYSYQARNDTGMVTFNGTKLQKVFVNGDKAYMSFGFVANSNTDPFWYNSVTYSLTNSDVIEYGLISDIQQILTILEENQDIIEDIYSELQTVVSNTSLANNYLETIAKLRQWHPYTESIPFLITLFRKGYQIIDNDLNNTGFTNYMDYPIFVIPSGSIIEERTMYTTSTQNEYYIVFGTNENINNVTNFNTYFDFQIVDGNFEYNTSSIIVNSGFRIIKLTIRCTSNGTFRFKAKSSSRYIMPIVSVRKDQMHFSTDFALLFQFSNDFLDNIQKIANGTTQSNSAASDLESEASEYSDIADDVIGVEEGLTSNFETEVNKIDLNTGLNVFGGNFMTSATWVRTQFDRLTENTPYGSLVVYGLTLGFALLMLGKVFL